MNSSNLPTNTSFLSAIGWDLSPQTYFPNNYNLTVPSLEISISPFEKELLIGNAQSELASKLGPIFKAKVPKDALMRRMDNGAYLSAQKDSDGHLVGQPGFEEIHPEAIITQTMNRLYYNLANQLRAQYAELMIKNFNEAMIKSQFFTLVYLHLLKNRCKKMKYCSIKVSLKR